MFAGLLMASATIVVWLRYRRSGWSLAHWRNDLVAIVVLAAVARIALRVIAL